MTRGVSAALSPAEVVLIVELLQAAVHAQGGLDYLQVFSSDDGRRVWAIDDVEHWTLLLPEEY